MKKRNPERISPCFIVHGFLIIKDTKCNDKFICLLFIIIIFWSKKERGMKSTSGSYSHVSTSYNIFMAGSRHWPEIKIWFMMELCIHLLKPATKAVPILTDFTLTAFYSSRPKEWLIVIMSDISSFMEGCSLSGFSIPWGYDFSRIKDCSTITVQDGSAR